MAIAPRGAHNCLIIDTRGGVHRCPSNQSVSRLHCGKGPMVNYALSPSDLLAVLCPQCQRPMMRGAPKPIMFTSGLSDVSYSCEGCGTETVRTVNGDGTLHMAGSKTP